jgi:hypothetical protein
MASLDSDRCTSANDPAPFQPASAIAGRAVAERDHPDSALGQPAQRAVRRPDAVRSSLKPSITDRAVRGRPEVARLLQGRVEGVPEGAPRTDGCRGEAGEQGAGEDRRQQRAGSPASIRAARTGRGPAASR